MKDETAMEDEFDVTAAWTLEAVQRLGPDHALPATCRGTASPAALEWLEDRCGLTGGTRLLDVGGGTGGPAEHAVRRCGARPFLVEPMPEACRTARELFGLPALVGSGDRLPLAAGTADAVWCLGVLCTTPGKAAVLAEAHRVLRPGGSLGLFVLLADEPRPAGAPEGNLFPSGPELDRLLAGAGFRVTDRHLMADFPAAPDRWRERIAKVEAVIEERHGADPRHRAASEQQRRMGRLMDAGTVTGTVLHAQAA